MRNKKVCKIPRETLNEVKVMIMFVDNKKSHEGNYVSYEMRSAARETSKGKVNLVKICTFA